MHPVSAPRPQSPCATQGTARWCLAWLWACPPVSASACARACPLLSPPKPHTLALNSLAHKPAAAPTEEGKHLRPRVGVVDFLPFFFPTTGVYTSLRSGLASSFQPCLLHFHPASFHRRVKPEVTSSSALTERGGFHLCSPIYHDAVVNSIAHNFDLPFKTLPQDRF